MTDHGYRAFLEEMLAPSAASRSAGCSAGSGCFAMA